MNENEYNEYNEKGKNGRRKCTVVQLRDSVCARIFLSLWAFFFFSFGLRVYILFLRCFLFI